MSLIGSDFRRGLHERLYAADNRTSLGIAIAIAAGLLILSVVLQLVFAAVSEFVFASDLSGDPRATIKAYMIGILPAGLITAAVAYGLARIGGGRPVSVLCLRWPKLGLGGWTLTLIAFLVIVYGFAALAVMLVGIDLSQYTPGPNGQSPDTGSAGLVKEALFDLANEPLFWAAWPSVTIGAPLSEELIFRGQLFAALAQSRMGTIGAAIVTSAGWALLHATEPWFTVVVIFVMGLTLSFLLVRFGSLWITIICHALWNAVFSLVALVSAQS